ncbi:phasin family protein [Pseudoduganella sp. RAF53_2]|jgi:phasin family protein|uniref:phasin family protein n=1 Tax=unclassified Pseudoduganella TaxID=2637179 RepID=UPI003F997F0A
MFQNPEQFAAATKALFQFQLETFNTLTEKAVHGLEQVVDLNMTTAKTGVEQSMATSQQMAQATDPKAAIAVMSARLQPGMAATNAYNRQLTEIITEIHNEFTKAADAHLAEAKNNLSALIEDVTKNVKPGSENAVQIVKAAIENAFSGYEQVTNATRQAVSAFEQQIAKVSEQAEHLVKK